MYGSEGTPRVLPQPLGAIPCSSSSFWLHVFMYLKSVMKTQFPSFSACWEFHVGVCVSVCCLLLQSGSGVGLRRLLCPGPPRRQELLRSIRPISPARLLRGCARWAERVPHVLRCDVAATSGTGKTALRPDAVPGALLHLPVLLPGKLLLTWG